MPAPHLTAAALAWSGLSLGATALCVLALVALHLAPTGLTPWDHAVSQYGIGPWRALYRVQTLAMALAAASLAVAVAVGLGRGADAWGLGALGAVALARGAISWFPMDAPGAARSATGAAHGRLAIVAFLGLAVAARSLARTFAHHHLPDAAIVAGAVAMGLALVAMVGLRLGGTRRLFGLVERVFYLGALTFLAGASLGLLWH